MATSCWWLTQAWSVSVNTISTILDITLHHLSSTSQRQEPGQSYLTVESFTETTQESNQEQIILVLWSKEVVEREKMYTGIEA